MVTYNLTHDSKTGLVYGVATSVAENGNAAMARLRLRSLEEAADLIGQSVGETRVVLLNARRIEKRADWFTT